MLRMKKRTSIKGSAGNRSVVTANAQSISGGSGASGHPQSRALGGTADTKDSLLHGVLKMEPAVLLNAYLDMYTYDPIVGGGIDMMRMLPWSPIKLSGADDNQLEVFNRSLELLNMSKLLPEIDVDYYVLGSHISTPIYSQPHNAFVDLIPHSVASCQIEEIPFFSKDPLITLKVGEELKKFATSTDPRVVAMRKNLPRQILSAFSSPEVKLDPISTLYMPRTSFSSTQTGMSMLTRVLPVYLLERLLYKGTMSEASRRQRSTLHVQAGDETWQPNEEELSSLVGLFQQAESDPISAIVATQHNVLTQEIRPSGDIWSWMQDAPWFSEMKLAAMGISDAIISGESSLSNMETALSLFNEKLISHRTMMTNRLFYSKLFPMIAVANDFKRSDVELKTMARAFSETASGAGTFTNNIAFQVNDTNQLVIPTVEWEKSLKPIADEAQMDLLDRLAESGVPISLRKIAATGGMDFDQLLEGLEQDKKDRDEIDRYSPNEDEGEDDGGMSFASAVADEDTLVAALHGNETALASLLGNVKNANPSSTSAVKPRHVLSRDYGNDSEPVVTDHSGKRVLVREPHKHAKKENRTIHKALGNISDPNVRAERLKKFSSLKYTKR